MLQYFIIIVIFLLVVYLLSWFFNGSKSLSGFSNAQTALVIPPASLPPGTSVNYTYSVWIYIDDWNYRYGQEKIIFLRGIKGTLFMPALTLGAIDNTLQLTMTTDEGPFESMIPNIPLQKWTNITVSLSTKSLDMYINGKLVKTSVLPGMPKSDPNASLYLTPDNGFSGYTSRFFYKNDAIGPQDAWNIYKKGPGGNLFSNFLNQYKIQLNFLKGDDVKASLTI